MRGVLRVRQFDLRATALCVVLVKNKTREWNNGRTRSSAEMNVWPSELTLMLFMWYACALVNIRRQREVKAVSATVT